MGKSEDVAKRDNEINKRYCNLQNNQINLVVLVGCQKVRLGKMNDSLRQTAQAELMELVNDNLTTTHDIVLVLRLLKGLRNKKGAGYGKQK